MGLGVGFAVAKVDADVTAYVAPKATIRGSIRPPSHGRGDAQLQLHILGFAGALSGFASIGGAVSFVTDTSSAAP